MLPNIPGKRATASWMTCAMCALHLLWSCKVKIGFQIGQLYHDD